MSLREVQRALAAAILDPHPDDDGAGASLLELVADDGLPADRRVQIHRHNTEVLLTRVLEGAFPSVAALVGATFFEQAARAFVRAEPPRVPRLYEYGDGFATFLAGYAPAAGLPYLADVAALEWAVNASFHAPDAPHLAREALGELAPDDVGRLRLIPHPSLRLLHSAYPVDRIWRMARPGGDRDDVPDLDAGPVWLRVHRVELDVRLEADDPAGHAFTRALTEGEPVHVGWECALAVDPRFDLAAALAAHLRAGTFTDLRLGPG